VESSVSTSKSLKRSLFFDTKRTRGVYSILRIEEAENLPERVDEGGCTCELKYFVPD
jgi:hypothetical protein